MRTKRQRVLVSAWTLVCCVWLSISAANAQNLVGNPGFENAIPEAPWWSKTGNCWTDDHTAARSGSYYFAFGGADTTPNGVLSQTISTTPATAYTLTFWHGIYAWNQTASQKLNVTVSGIGTLTSQSYTLTATGNTTGRTEWTKRTVTFVANSDTTTIQFADDATNPTVNTDLILDDVSLTATAGLGAPTPTPTATPEPTATPTPPPEIQQVFETDNDTRTVANGYVTTFHAGKSLLIDSTANGTIATPAITVATVSGDAVAVPSGVLLIDKNGNPVALSSVSPGTRMQAVEVIDDPAVGLMVREIMVDQ